MKVKRTYQVYIDYLRQYSEQLRKDLESQGNCNLPPDYKLVSSDFSKNATYEALRSYIRNKLGGDWFNPINLYKYIFEILRNDDSKNLYEQKIITWKVAGNSQFPDALFKLIGFDGIEDFVLNYDGGYIDEVIVEKQKELLKNINSDKQVIRRAFYCFIANLEGKRYKAGILVINNDNSINFQFQGENAVRYHGRIDSNETISTFALYKNEVKKNSPPDVSMTFLNGEGIEDHIFYFGNFNGVNNNDHFNNDPALVRGTIVLEQIDLSSFDLKVEQSIYSLPIPSLDSRIAFWVSGQRVENKMIGSPKSFKNEFSEKREEELNFVNQHFAGNDSSISIAGKYLLLIYSKRHNAMRKLVFSISEDWTICAEAKRYNDGRDELVKYNGNISWIGNGLLKFKAKKEFPQIDELNGIFQYQNGFKPLYGITSGIFKMNPKIGLSIFVKKSEQLLTITDFEVPKLINLNSEEFDQLDEVLSISEFFSGHGTSKFDLFSKLIMNDYRSLFNRMLFKKRGEYDGICGFYEEYYYESETDILRKDLIQINPDGSVWMMGNYSYTGIAENHSIIIDIQLSPSGKRGFPVNYKLHFEGENALYTSGVRSSISNDNRQIETQMVILHLRDKSCKSNKEFFRQSCEDIIISGPVFRNLNEELNGIGNILVKNSKSSASVSTMKELNSKGYTLPIRMENKSNEKSAN